MVRICAASHRLLLDGEAEVSSFCAEQCTRTAWEQRGACLGPGNAPALKAAGAREMACILL